MNTDDRIIEAFQAIASFGYGKEYKQLTKSDLFAFLKRARHISGCMLKEIEGNAAMMENHNSCDQ